jgi:DNA-directed RNA polymerase specialized sigma24 family protein
MPGPSEPEPSVKQPLTRRRRRRPVENDEYAAFVRRVLRAYASRIARGDIDAIAELSAVAAELDGVVRQAVTGLRGSGYSWADIAARLGVTRQAAQQRWGRGKHELPDPVASRVTSAQAAAVLHHFHNCGALS